MQKNSDSSCESPPTNKAKERRQEVMSSTEEESEIPKRTALPLAAALLGDSSTEDEETASIRPGELAEIVTTLIEFKSQSPTGKQIPSAKGHQLSETMSVLGKIEGPAQDEKARPRSVGPHGYMLCCDARYQRSKGRNTWRSQRC